MKMDHTTSYFYKFDNEEFDVEFDFSNSLASGETLSSTAVSATDSNGTTVTITKTVTTSTPYCYFTVYEGTAGETYYIKLIGTSSLAMKYTNHITCECFGSVTLNTNLGDPNANSYVTVKEASDYIRNVSGHTSTWDLLSLEGKKRLLIEAAKDVDKFNFIDNKYYNFQALEFPRNTHSRLTGDVATPCTINSFKNTGFTSDTYGTKRSNSNYWKYGSVHITNGTPLYDVRTINTSNITTDVVAMLSNFSATPASGSSFIAFEPLDYRIKDAQCEQVLNILGNMSSDELQAYGAVADKVKIGDVYIDFKDGSSATSQSIGPSSKKLLSKWIQRSNKLYRA
jgi:hypothetical protein